MRKRVAVRWGLAVGLLAAGFGHLVYWYWPRERAAARPSEAALPLLGDPDADFALWLPYPHQNLARLESYVGDLAAWAVLIGRDRSGAALALPRLGPYSVPPAFELTLALPPAGREPRVLLSAYPSAALIARAAGRLAGNPWLAGGTLPGRPGTGVDWEGDLWRWNARPATEAAFGFFPVADEPHLLALARSARPVGPFPAGLYRLARFERGLEIRSGTPHPGPLAAVAAPRAGSRPAAWLVTSSQRGSGAALVIWPDSGAAPPFPAAATLGWGGDRRPRVPGEELYRLAGRKPIRIELDGVELAALSQRELDRVRPLVDALRQHADERPRARRFGEIDPAGLRAVAERVRSQLAGLPLGQLLGLDPERWSELLAPWDECGPIGFELLARPDAVRVALCPPVSPVESPR